MRAHAPCSQLSSSTASLRGRCACKYNTMLVIVPVLLTILLGNALVLEGLEFHLSSMSIPTDGSGRIRVTDINSKDTEALICQSQSVGGLTDWYLDPEDESATSIADADRINGYNDRGWHRNRNNMTRDGYRIVRLKRVSDTAVEGRFTCRIPGDSDSPRGLLILYPITSVTVTIETIEVSGSYITFRVRCTSTGGRVLNMSVTGPDFNFDLSNIKAVGTQMWIGNDSYSATTANITAGSDEQSYTCTASNGVSSLTDRVVLGASPEGMTVENILKPLSVRVSWQAVEDADRYTITFTKAEGLHQQGLCKNDSHTASVSVATLNANISIGQDVEKNVTTMLRAYTTYFITVEDVLDTSDGSTLIIFTTSQTGAAHSPQNVSVTAVQSTTISVRWVGFSKCRYVNGRIEKYRIQYSAQPNGTVQNKDHPVNSLIHEWDSGTNTLLDGLTPFTNYSIQVAVVNEQEDVGPYSHPTTAQTKEDTPGPVVITAVPSFFKVTITWNKPAMPNGVITHYEVHYGRNDFRSSAITTTTGPNTIFTTPGQLELGTELFFTVRAYTRVGGGEPETVVVSTLTKPFAVQEVTVIPLTDTEVQVLWDVLIIPDFPIDSYTVVYSPVSQSHRRHGEMTAVFPGSVISGVITGLEPAVIYKFQVFANVTVGRESVGGERSDPVCTTTTTTETTTSLGDDVYIITGVLVGLLFVVAVTVFTVVLSVYYCKMKRQYDKSAYRLSSPRHSDISESLASVHNTTNEEMISVTSKWTVFKKPLNSHTATVAKTQKFNDRRG